MREYVNEAVELLKKLISIPSISRDESAAADCMFETLKGYGLAPTRVNNNIIVCSEQLPERQTILLNAHIDTVKPVASWTKDPFSPTQEGDTLYG